MKQVTGQPTRSAAYVAAFLVKLDQHHRYFSDLRAYLLEHPALARLLGFDPAKLSSRKHFGRVPRQLPNDSLQFLRDATVNGLSSDTCGREWLLVTPRSAMSWVTSLEIMALPRSAWIVNCPCSMPCLAHVSTTNCSANAAV